jgi:hypothetical protein
MIVFSPQIHSWILSHIGPYYCNVIIYNFFLQNHNIDPPCLASRAPDAEAEAT